MPKFLLQANGEDDFGQKNYVVELEIIRTINDKRMYPIAPISTEGFPIWTIMVGRKKYFILRLECPKKIVTYDKIKANGRDFNGAVVAYIQATRHPSDFDRRRQALYLTKKIEKVDPMRG